MADYLLRAIDIHKSFDGVHALNGVSLEIKPGEIHCLAGENGCGKSTLIKIISGVYQGDSGIIEFQGKSLTKITPLDAIKNGIQVIYQDFSIFPNLTVMENLAINSELIENRKIVNWKHVHNIAQKAIDMIDLKIDLDVPLGTRSVAEKQMVAICRALMFNAKLIIMDEPTTALTKKEVNALFKIILKLKAQGIAILFVSHKLDEVFEISERYTVFRSGALIASGNTKDLDDIKFTFYMTGREFEAKKFVPKRTTPNALMEVKDLSLDKHFEKVNFAIKGGEILGITGLLDSGRTELALALFGIKPATAGKILIKGKETIIDSPQKAISNKIGFVPEDRLSEGLFLSQSIGDNIIISEIDNLTNRFKILDQKRCHEEIDEWIKKLSIVTPNAGNACSTLSGGNQQRIVLAKWLACRPDIMILSGPTVGVDIGSKHDIHTFLQLLANDGMAIIIISDDLPEVLANCSRIIIMKDGKISGELDSSNANEQIILQNMM